MTTLGFVAGWRSSCPGQVEITRTLLESGTVFSSDRESDDVAEREEEAGLTISGVHQRRQGTDEWRLSSHRGISVVSRNLRALSHVLLSRPRTSTTNIGGQPCHGTGIRGLHWKRQR